MNDNELFGTKTAAMYLDLTVRGLWYHIQRGNIRPAKIGKTLVFTRHQLDRFLATRRKAGRPRKEID